MANEQSTKKSTYLWAFVFGLLLMIAVYFLFQGAAKRTRTGSADDVDTETTGKAVVTAVVQTAGAAEGPVSPSAFLGVEVVCIDTVIAEQLDIPGGEGVLINMVVPGSPAQKAGLERGDVIVELSKKAVNGLDAFKQIMLELEPGQTVRIGYIRDGQKAAVYAELVERPAAMTTAQTTDSNDSGWGAALSPITSGLRESLGIGSDVSGVAILSVVRGGVADRAGLLPGDVITSVDKTPISDMNDFFGAISADDDETALLSVYRRGALGYVPIDSSGIRVADQTQAQGTLRQRIFSIFTGGAPFSSEDDEEGPKGGKFAEGDVQLTADNTAFNRPSTVPGDVNTGGSGPSSTTGMNRPSTVPPQSGGSANDIVFFVGLLLIAIVYLAYREYHRPAEVDGKR